MQGSELELLAPAGSSAKLRTAISYGADAVYMGGKVFSLRANSESPENEELINAVKTAHDLGKKVYITLNILARNRDIEGLPSYLDILKKAGADGLIISDMGVFSVVRDYWKDAEIHISTQASVLNADACNFFYKLGAKRIVLARELSLSEISDIRKNTPKDLELEAFVHGAMCISYSGRCLLSDYMAGRSGNRGDCAGSCRWKYYLMEEKRPGEYYPAFEDENGTYILNSKDLCMIEHIPEMANAGITSFKIEGRMKSEFYLGVITRAYRTAIDGYIEKGDAYKVPASLLHEVDTVSHREYCTGFYIDKPGQNYKSSSYIRKTELIARVLEGGETPLLVLNNKFGKGELLTAVLPSGEIHEFKAEEIFAENKEPLEDAHTPNMRFYLKCGKDLPPETIIRRNKN